MNTSEEALRRDLISGYGFCQGQKYGIEKIGSKYPDLIGNLRQIELKFNLLFGKSCNFFESFLSSEIKQKVTSLGKSEIDAIPFTLANANDFLDRVQKRSEGKVESPFIETLLTWHPDFKDKPELEVVRGFTKLFSTRGHPKAKGLHVEVRVPISWKSREGSRPNIVQFFRAKNGFSDISFSLMIKEATSPNEKRLTQREIDALFSVQGVREWAQEEGTVIESKPIVLEGLKGGFMVIDNEIDRLDQKLAIRMAQYVLYFDNRYIYLQFSYSGIPATKYQWQQEFEKNKPLFGLVANSLVIADQYTK